MKFSFIRVEGLTRTVEHKFSPQDMILNLDDKEVQGHYISGCRYFLEAVRDGRITDREYIEQMVNHTYDELFWDYRFEHEKRDAEIDDDVQEVHYEEFEGIE